MLQAVELGVPELHPLKALQFAREKKPTADEPNPEGLLYASSQASMDAYQSEMRTLHGDDVNIFSEPVDPTAVVLAGGGKPHGRYCLLDSVIETTTSISQLRATDTSSGSSGMSYRGHSRRATTVELQVCFFSIHFLSVLHTRNLY